MSKIQATYFTSFNIIYNKNNFKKNTNLFKKVYFMHMLCSKNKIIFELHKILNNITVWTCNVYDRT